MTPVRWGLLSTARINRRLIPAIRASARGRLVAVASRTPEAAAAYARDWDIPHSFGSYEAMLASDLVDAVYISLPNHLHAEWSVRALEAGKHVLCEKPLALSLAEVDRMAAAARAHNRILAEAFMYLHLPQTRLAQAWVREGRLGEITLVRGYFSFRLSDRPHNIRLDPDKGGGSLWDIGVYPISFAQFMLGALPQQVWGLAQIGDTGVDEVFAGQMHYATGAVAQIGCSFRVPFYTMAEIIGTEGRLVFNRPFIPGYDDIPIEMTWYPAAGEPEILTFPAENWYLAEIEDMHDAILDGKPPHVSLEASRGHVQTALALYRAAADGHPVALSTITP